MYIPSLIAPTPRRITALVTWFVPQVPLLVATGPPRRPPPPPPSGKRPVFVPPPPVERWDQPLPDPMGMALAEEWENEQKQKNTPTRSSETPRLS